MKTTIASVIIPVYNGEQYLKECIDSIICQSIFCDIEIILVDDGSTDASGLLCDKYALKYENIHVIHKKNGGLVSARKIGVINSKGKYITFVDADDWIDKDAIQKMVEFAENQASELVIGGMKFEYENRTEQYEYSIKPGIYSDIEKFTENYIYSGVFFKFGILPTICGKLFLRDKYVQFQMNVPDELKIGEDVAVTIPYILNATSKIIVIDTIDYHYRQNDKSMVHQFSNANREFETNSLYKTLDFYLKKDKSLLNRIEYYKASMLIGLLKNNIMLKDGIYNKHMEIKRIMNNSDYQHTVNTIDQKNMRIQYKIIFKLFSLKASWMMLILITLKNKG